MIPSSIADIWEILCQVMPSQNPTVFRVRNVETLTDYLICEVYNWKWSLNKAPSQMLAVEMQDSFRRVMLDAKEIKYVILSDPDEVAYLTKTPWTAVLQILRKSYRINDSLTVSVV